MKFRSLQKIGIPTYLFVSLISCGGSEGDRVAGGGIGGSGSAASLTRGTITGFGSVFVSGKEYDTTNALIIVDNQQGVTINNLKQGMVVLVKGSLNQLYYQNQPATRNADIIVYESTLEGLVERIASAGLPMIVLGQTVLVNDLTIIDASIPERDIRHLHHGDHVQISGFVKGNGIIYATYVQLQRGPVHYHVKGFVKNQNALTKQLTIGNLRVDYAGADTSQLGNPSAGTSWQGMLVDVAGIGFLNDGLGLTGGLLTATKIEPDGLSTDSDISDAEIEGIVTQVSSKDDFVLETVHVQTTPKTVFEGGVASDIRPGVRLDLEGQFINDVFIPTLVSLDDDDNPVESEKLQ